MAQGPASSGVVDRAEAVVLDASWFDSTFLSRSSCSFLKLDAGRVMFCSHDSMSTNVMYV